MRKSNACPLVFSPRAVLPTRWMYSCQRHYYTVNKYKVLTTSVNVYLPLDHQVDHIVQSNQLQVCQGLWQQHQCTKEYLLLRCKIRKMWLFSSAVFVYPKNIREWKLNYNTQIRVLYLNVNVLACLHEYQLQSYQHNLIIPNEIWRNYTMKRTPLLSYFDSF